MRRFGSRQWAWQGKGPGKLLGLITLLVMFFQVSDAPQAFAESAGLPWSKLEYSKNYLWLTASAELSLQVVESCKASAGWIKPTDREALYPSGKNLWQLSVSSNIASNSEKVVAWLDPEKTGVYQRTRFSAGKDQRFKQYRYLCEGVFRNRREPANGEASEPPETWSKASPQFLAYPADVDSKATLTSPYGLLVAASAGGLKEPGDSWTGYVHTDQDFHRVELRVSGVETIPVEFTLTDKQSTCLIKETRSVLVIDVHTKILGKETPEDQFELMGLTGKISILLDPDSHLPLRLRGDVPTVGPGDIELVKAGTDTLSACGAE